ncbi:MAG: FG-GAP repeat protein [Planctomycetes bacterium]|nr:FG-GAP repeat protein [Planctomycetota bacterium]
MLHLPALLAVAFSPFQSLQPGPASGSTPSRGDAATSVAPEFLWSAGAGGTLELAPEGGMFGWNARVDAGGVRFESGVAWTKTPGERAWVRVRTTAFGRVDDAQPMGSGTVERDGARASIVRPGIVEWFEGRSDGLEQGWTIATPPAGERSSAVWIGLEFEGLEPQIAEDGKSARLVDARASEKLSYRNLYVRDATGRQLEARMSPSSQGQGIQVADADAVYPITIDPVLSSVAWTFEHNQASSLVLTAFTAGDVNGDGFSDFSAATPFYDVPGAPDAGKVWVFHGGPSGPTLAANGDWSSSGPAQPGWFFGSSLAPVGDLNGDSYDDVAIGCANWSSPEPSEGAVLVYRGGPSGLEATPWFVVEGGIPGLRLNGVAYAGDVNGDGFDDLFVGTYASTGEGEVRVYFGGNSPPTSPAWTKRPTQLGLGSSDFFELNISGAGDVNADGFRRPADWFALCRGKRYGNLDRRWRYGASRRRSLEWYRARATSRG